MNEENAEGQALTTMTPPGRDLHSEGKQCTLMIVLLLYDIRGNSFVFPHPRLHYASSSFLILRSGGSVLRSLLPPLLLDDGGSVLTLTWDGEVEGGGGGGKSDG